MSVANAIQDPLKGITLAEYSLVPLACRLCPKNTPGDLCICETIARSVPLMTKV